MFNMFYWKCCVLLSCTVYFSESAHRNGHNQVRDIDNKIVGGEETTIEKHPYQVSFIVNQSWFCGGFIISPEYVMTAAHCVQGATPEVVKLRVGSTFRDRGGLVVPVADLSYHSQWNKPQFDHDIAVMRLKEPLNFTDTISAVELPEQNEEIPDGSEVVVSGWGLTKQGGAGIPKHLMDVTIPTVNHFACRLSYPTILTKNMLCAGNYFLGGEGSCQGDSGGPAVLDGTAVGIVSFARGCSQPLSPSVFTNIASLRGWVEEHTGF